MSSHVIQRQLMGNESSSIGAGKSAKDGNLNGAIKQQRRRFTPKNNNKKRVLSEQNRRTDSVDSENGSAHSTFISCGTAAKAVSRKTSAQHRHQHLVEPQLSATDLAASGPTRPVSPASATTPQLLSVPDFEAVSAGSASSRKSSCADFNMASSLEPGQANSRRRSRSLCAQQLKSDVAQVQTAQSSTSRRSSNGALPSLARIRIQHCYKRAKPAIGQMILKRSCALRPEMKPFLSCLPEERVEELASSLYHFVTNCVNHIDDGDTMTELSKEFGRMQAQLCNYGFRHDFFSIIADATIAECVRLDGGAHKRCETLLAWSQLIQFMFSSVRDGYYAEIRQQRRSSLPQHKLLLKQNSHNVSVDIVDL